MRLNNSWRTKLTLFALCLFHFGFSQNAWVYFQDKCDATGDFFDSPVCQEYTKALNARGIKVIGTSKWLNAAFVKDANREEVISFDFVSHFEYARKLKMTEEKMDEDFSYGESDVQLEMLNLPAYHQMGNTGKGVRMGVFDAGFFKVDSLSIFDSLWYNNQIYAERDFVLNSDTLTYRNSTHGMLVLALAGINYPDSMMGAAPGADFMLVRTEDASSEKHIEEYNWLNAMEWADSVGVDIIHSSLGYSLFDTLEGDYSYSDMDGESTIITIAAELAASRGIFVTNSAGNSGAKPWKYITAPCDGPHVLCVGAVDSFRVKAAFSSFGPSADGRVKPDVMAMGRRATIPNEFGTLVRSNGTSLSGPLVAGLVACLMEGNPTSSNDQLFEAIIRSADRYTMPDSGYGYGIPDALVADSLLKAWGPATIEKHRSIDTKIYPNPASSMIRIECAPSSTFVLRNQIGQTILDGRLRNWLNFVPIESLPNGYYFIEVNSGDEKVTDKIGIFR